MYLGNMSDMDRQIILAGVAVYVKRKADEASTDKRFRYELKEMILNHLTGFLPENKEQALYSAGFLAGACNMWLARARNSYNLTLDEFRKAHRLINDAADILSTEYEV